MKICSLFLFMLSISTVAFADTRSDKIAEIQNMILNIEANQGQSKATLMTPMFRESIKYDWFIKLIQDESYQFSREEMEQIFNSSPTTREETAKRICFIMGILFHERDGQKTILSIYDKLTPIERGFIPELFSTVYKPLITRNYLPFFLTGLTQTINDCESMSEKRPETNDEKELNEFLQKQFALENSAKEWMLCISLTENENAGPSVKNIIDKYVRRSDFRFNLVAVAINRMGSDAIPVARWYFEFHAWEPFKIAVVARYLRKYDHPTTANAYISNKQATLQESLKALNPEYEIPGVPGNKPSDKATKESATTSTSKTSSVAEPVNKPAKPEKAKGEK